MSIDEYVQNCLNYHLHIDDVITVISFYVVQYRIDPEDDKLSKLVGFNVFY